MLAGAIFLFLALSTLAQTCFSASLIGHRLSAVWPQTSRLRWNLIGTTVAWPFVATGLGDPARGDLHRTRCALRPDGRRDDGRICPAPRRLARTEARLEPGRPGRLGARRRGWRGSVRSPCPSAGATAPGFNLRPSSPSSRRSWPTRSSLNRGGSILSVWRPPSLLHGRGNLRLIPSRLKQIEPRTIRTGPNDPAGTPAHQAFPNLEGAQSPHAGADGRVTLSQGVFRHNFEKGQPRPIPFGQEIPRPSRSFMATRQHQRHRSCHRSTPIRLPTLRPWPTRTIAGSISVKGSA